MANTLYPSETNRFITPKRKLYSEKAVFPTKAMRFELPVVSDIKVWC